MAKFVVAAYGTLRKDVLVEAETVEAAVDMVASAFEDGSLSFDIEGDYMPDYTEFETMTLQESIEVDGIGEADCVKI